ncbi:hypothetical protein TURU_007719 [Turdus rufiventris]|nr:hypothetical protein TURU_007719 [Turdus rufiventris]
MHRAPVCHQPSPRAPTLLWDSEDVLRNKAAGLGATGENRSKEQEERQEPPPPLSSSDIVHPIRVDERGSFVSYELSHRALHRRSPLSRSSLPAFYELHYRGQPLRFNLSLNRHLLAPGFVSERRFGGMAGARIRPRSHNSCHMLGEVRGRAPQGGLAALSTCDGLNVGCDYEIDSHAVEDRCGVCHGDGSTCHTVHKTFEDSEGLGYVDIGIIPVGAREIRIEEVAEAGNFLALRSEDPEKYFLNGGWTIQWNGDYRVAGTTFTYKRTGNWENLTSPGPTVEPVWIQLLFQETNPGVRYQYTIQRPADSENEIEQPEFLWRFGSWTTCTATCGTGVQRQVVHCVERLAGLVEERFCDPLTRPDDQQRTCSEEPCPASSPLQGKLFLAGVQCSVTCGNGTQRRPVHCSNSTGAECDPAERPSPDRVCSLPPCHQSWDTADWSGSGSSSREVFNEVHYIPSNHIPEFNPLIPNIPESNDVNVITEEDFSARKGNVFVDDFYYDYNFINFHEDLSYYPFTEKESKGEEAKPELSPGGVEGPWECSRSCGGGTKVRDVHCVDTRDQRLLRPFHCQAGLSQPPAQLPCRSSPCLPWYTSSWRECSEPCGGGEQARLVTCPEPGRCEETTRPNSTRPCNTQPCTTWVVGSWGQCSAPCGGGIQRRQVKCMDTRTGMAEEDSSLCDHEPWPESTQKCNPQDCESSEPGENFRARLGGESCGAKAGPE